MPINTRQLLDGVSILADDNNMRANLKESTKGAMICGMSCLAGGVLLGPLGLAVGGTVGGLTAAYMARGKFKPVGQIIREDLTETQRQELAEKIIGALREFGPEDLAILLPLMVGNVGVQQAVLRTVASFVTNEMRLQIID